MEDYIKEGVISILSWKEEMLDGVVQLIYDSKADEVNVCPEYCSWLNVPFPLPAGCYIFLSYHINRKQRKSYKT